jgi:hypothetical protein
MIVSSRRLHYTGDVIQAALHRLVGTLDLNQRGLARGRCAINESPGERAEHHPTR